MSSTASVVRATLQETGSSARLVFANANLRRVNLALAGSMVGDWAFNTAVTVFAFLAGGSTLVAGYYAVRTAIIAVTLPVLAALADRLPRRGFMIVTDLLRAVLVTVAATGIWSGWPAWAVLLVAGTSGLVGAPFRPAQASLLPSLARSPYELTASNAISSTFESLAFFVGPALAAGLLALADVPVVFLVNAVSFCWSAWLTSRLQIEATGPPAPDLADAAPEGLLASSLAGFRVIGAEPRLRLLTALAVAQILVCGASMVFTVVLAVEIMRTGPNGVGLLDAVLGIGATAGGLLALARARRGTLAVDFGLGVLGWSAPLLLVVVWPSPVSCIAAMVLIGAANPLVDVNLVTLLQRIAPPAVMGRVFGASESLIIGGSALGALVTAPLVAGLGVRWALLVLALPVSVAVLLCVPALRRLDASVRPPDHLELVAGLPLFAPLAPAAQEELARALVRVEAPSGTVVIAQGAVGDRFYIVQSGGLAVEQDGLALGELGAGDCFGEIALLRDVPRTASVVARTDVALWALERQVFLAAVGSDLEVGNRFEALVARRMSP